MWYFAWVLGVGFAVLVAILNAMWMENAEARKLALTIPDRFKESQHGQPRIS